MRSSPCRVGNQEKLCKEIYGDEVVYVPWQRPGFDIGLKIEQLIKDDSKAKAFCLVITE